MELTTLCHIEEKDSYLMLHRVKKQHDINTGKWIGVGGHLEAGESPEDCLIREVKEETGLTLTHWNFRGIVTFCSNPGNYCEYMFLYTADGFEGTLSDCSEGELRWIPREKLLSLSLWEGDRIFLRLLDTGRPFFSLKLCYEDDRLCEAVLDGAALELFDIRDENGKPTGVVRERQVAHEDGSLHGTAHIWIARREAGGSISLLLQKRSAHKDAHPGCYDISSAGHLSAGQDFLSGALRELYEELGIAAAPEDLQFLGFHHGYCEDTFYGRPFRNREISAVYLYQKPVDETSLTLQESEVESVRWMPLEEVSAHVQAHDPLYCIWEEELTMIREVM